MEATPEPTPVTEETETEAPSDENLTSIELFVKQNPVVTEEFQENIFRNVLFNYLVLKGYLEREQDRRMPVPVLSAAGLKKLAVTVTRMCQLYLGLSEDITWCRDADENLCHKLMAHTLSQGNFGRKQDRKLHGAVGVLNALDSDLNFFQLLHRHGCYNWKAVKKHPWLKPFAWLYQLIRYIRKAFRKGLPFGALRKASRQQKKNADLLDELEVLRKDPTLQ